MSDERFDPDDERVRLLREVADDVRGDTSESEQLAAILYRISDLYDPDEETTPEEAYRSVRNVFRIKERGTLARERDDG
jgi:2,4-dienoyl-CoA reductase-like NADH-dependent reductase (Old Yellow Enzyme family)